VSAPHTPAAGTARLRQMLGDRYPQITPDVEAQVDDLIARAARSRLAWQSARQRAANHLAALIDADDERDGLRAEVVRLGRVLAKCANDQCGCLGSLPDDGQIDTALQDATDRLKGALLDAEVQERIERIKTRAKEMVVARGVRARLEEERIEPERCTTCVRGCLPGPCPVADLVDRVEPAPECPAHGEHPHVLGSLEEPRRCLDCPVCACPYVEYPEHAAGPCVLCGWRKP
jgi:hypothetical protein